MAKLIGTAPNQVPTNADLGTMAYQDAANMSGALTLYPLGTAALPVLCFSGDSNTGLWSLAADTLNFSTAGAERIRITSAGDVGIGTNGAPAQFVDIKKDQNATTFLRVQNSTSGTAGAVGITLHDGVTNKTQLLQLSVLYTTLNQFVADGTALNAGGAGGLSLAAPSGIIRFYSGATSERARFDASGNLLITGPGVLGYGVGSGGSTTQLTSRTTLVTLNKSNGAVTLFSAAGSATPTTFTVQNTLVAATDTVHVCVKSATNVYATFVTAVAAGSFNITFYALSGTATDAPVLNFSIIRASIT